MALCSVPDDKFSISIRPHRKGKSWLVRPSCIIADKLDEFDDWMQRYAKHAFFMDRIFYYRVFHVKTMIWLKLCWYEHVVEDGPKSTGKYYYEVTQ